MTSPPAQPVRRRGRRARAALGAAAAMGVLATHAGAVATPTPAGARGGASRGVTNDTAFVWSIPAPYPRPAVPADNPMSVAMVELGRHLFYDPRLSVNGRTSCASCHQQSRAFTDGLAQSIGTTGERHPRSSMSLANVAYLPALTWADPRLTRLEEQARLPLLGEHPVEMGLAGHEARVLATLDRDERYRRLVARAFEGPTHALTLDDVVRAIAAFERTLISVRSPYDRYRFGGEPDAISPAAMRGEQLFFSGRKAGCFQCHGGWNFAGAVRHAGDTAAVAAYHNTGLYNLPGSTSYPAANTGLHAISGKREDIGRFRAPTLRNIAVTAPYMHDGSIATLDEVIAHYAAGGRTIAHGPHAGVGRDNANKAPAVHGFVLTAAEQRDLIAFLESLTDSTFLTDPAFADPWRRR